MAQADGNQLLAELQANGRVTLALADGEIELDNEDIEVRLQAKAGWAAAQGVGCVVVLNTEVTPELQREGIAKDLIRAIQNQRKEIDCQYTDRIQVSIDAGSDEVRQALQEHREMICDETLANSLDVGKMDSVQPADSEHGQVFVAKVPV